MANKSRTTAASTKRQNRKSSGKSFDIDDKMLKKVIKSPLLIGIIVFLLAGVIIGYFIASANIVFEPLMMKVNGTETENDYAEIDLSAIKATLQESKGADTPISAEELANAIEFQDSGISVAFFGKSLQDKVKTEYLYRKDVTEDATKTEKIDFTQSGVYYVVYTCDHFAFSNKKIIKTVYVTEVELDG